MRLLPPNTIPPQVLSVAVDLGNCSSGQAARSPSMRDVVKSLTRTFRSFQVNVTWSMNELGGHDLADTILADNPCHDIALRADAVWSSPGVGRSNFARGLSRRLQQAEMNGYDVSTLMTREPICHDNLDLLVKYEVDLVAQLERREADDARVRTLRYGVWEVPAVAELPYESNSWLTRGNSARRTQQKIDQAIKNETLCLVAVDAVSIVESSQLASLERLLRHAHRRHRQGVLRWQTLSEVSAEMHHVPKSRGASSILRAA